MKKRVLFTILFVIAFSLLAVFSASAEEFTEYTLVDDLGDPSWYTGNYQYMTDKTSRVVLANGDGTYTAYPAYYVLKYNITVSDGAVTEASISSIDYSHVNKTGKGYSAGSIYKIELPKHLTTISSGIFGLNIKEPNVTEIVMSDTIKTIGTHAFRGTTNLKRVVFSKNLTKISESAFQEARGLEEFVLPGGSEEYLDVSSNNIFYGCSALKEADFSARKIKALGQSFLSDCTNLGKVTLPESLEEIGYCSIYKCPKLYFASNLLPQSLKKVGFHFLSGCKSINSVLFFPEHFESFTQTYNFSNDKEFPAELTIVFLGKMTGKIPLEMVHASNRKFNIVFTQNTYDDLKGNFVTACDDGTLAYVGKTADTSDTNYITKEGTLELVLGNPKDANNKYKDDENGNTLYYFDKNYAVNIYLCGGDKVDVCYNVRSVNVVSGYANFITTPFAFNKQGHMDEGVHYDLTEVLSLPTCGDEGVKESTCVVCDRVAKIAIPATGDHTLSQISPCADKCSVCGQYVLREDSEHNLNKVYTYENGFDANGAYDNTCTNEGCTYHATGALDPIFKLDGFSTPTEYGKKGLAIGFEVNEEALSEYKATGKTISFGAYIVGCEKLGANDVYTFDGAVKAEVTESELTYFSMKVTGFEKGGNDDTKLCLGAYIVEENGDVSYLQAGEAIDGCNFLYTTYNLAYANSSNK